MIGVIKLIAKTISKMSFLTTGNFQNFMKSQITFLNAHEDAYLKAKLNGFE